MAAYSLRGRIKDKSHEEIKMIPNVSRRRKGSVNKTINLKANINLQMKDRLFKSFTMTG